MAVLLLRLCNNEESAPVPRDFRQSMVMPGASGSRDEGVVGSQATARSFDSNGGRIDVSLALKMETEDVMGGERRSGGHHHSRLLVDEVVQQFRWCKVISANGETRG